MLNLFNENNKHQLDHFSCYLMQLAPKAGSNYTAGIDCYINKLISSLEKVFIFKSYELTSFILFQYTQGHSHENERLS